MANFNTHLLSTAAGCSFAATLCMKVFALSVEHTLLLTLGGTIGGILPDIDLKYSTPGKILFTLLGALISAIWLFANIDRFTVVELWMIAVAIFLFLRFPCWWLFHQFTVHRGALHSLAAGLLFAFATAAAGDYLLALTPLLSWLLAAFVAGGYLLHLVLDEISGVDFLGARINRSFGSAMKLIDSNRLLASCLILFLTLMVWFWTPDIQPLLDAVDGIDRDWLDKLLPDYLRRW